VLINSPSGTCTDLVAALFAGITKRAVIVGERTVGKASVQNYFALDRGTMRITTAHAFRPSGKSLDRDTAPAGRPDEWGVTPDAGYAVDLTKKDATRCATIWTSVAHHPPRCPEEGEGDQGSAVDQSD